MKIVDRATFLKMPKNTLFSKYEPCCFEPFCIKMDSIQNIDFFYQQMHDSLSADDFIIACHSMEAGDSIPVDMDIESRDGLFDKDQLFAIWEKQDIELLIKRLENCL
jgi:hypothetical protein